MKKKKNRKKEKKRKRLTMRKTKTKKKKGQIKREEQTEVRDRLMYNHKKTNDAKYIIIIIL